MVTWRGVESKPSVLEEEDLVTVSYMADKLDLETVGDIIAIIEDKVKIYLSLLTLFIEALQCF